MRLFRRVVLGLGAFLVVGLLVWFGGLGPFGPIPGGVLFGTATPSADVDWSFTDAIGEIELQTRLFGLPYSVTTWCVAHEGVLYVPSGDCGRRWTRLVLSDGRVRIRADGRLYDMLATRQTDDRIGAALAPLVLSKYFGVSVDAAAWSAQDRGGCIFRLDSRP